MIKMKKNQLSDRLKIIFGCVVIGLLFSACSGNTSSKNYSQEELKQLRQSFQVTENIIAELELIHKETKTRMRPIKVEIAPRQPRHVWHKARSIYRSIQGLRSHKGLEVKQQPHAFSDDITPAEVYEILNKTLLDLRELRSTFNIAVNPEPAPLPKKTLPRDVYQNLDRINQMILGIENRTITPAHVYQVASDILVSLQQIRRRQGINNPIPAIQISKGKHPRDVYKQAHQLHHQLKEFSEKQGHPVSGGIELLNKKMSRIIPNDVIDVLINILADVDAMRASKGLFRRPGMPTQLNNTIPSDVYDKVSEGIATLETMI
jgi:hypothetical protein